MASALTPGLRSIRRNPGLSAVAALSLSLGLASTAALVSLLDAVGFRPLAVAAEGDLVQIDLAVGKERPSAASYADYLTLRGSLPSLAGLAAYSTRGAALSDPGETPSLLLTSVVSPNFFQTAGVASAIGRVVTDADDRPGAPPIVVISDRLWRRRYGADPAIAGRMIELDGVPATIIGVLPAAFTGFRPVVSPDLWMPVRTWSQLGRMSDAVWAQRGARERTYTLLGRLAPDQSLERLNGQLAAAAAALAREQPDDRRDARLQARLERTVRLGGLTVLRWLLWALVDVVVLIGCANVAGLLFGKLEWRRRELALRVALGASRAALVRQLLTESGMLASLGAVLGLVEGWALVRALPALLPPSSLPLGFDFRFDVHVILTTVGMSMGAVLAFGLWPALTATRGPLADTMKGDAPDRSRVSRLLIRRGLVTLQVAVSFVLLVAGGLLLRSLWNSERIPPGFAVRPALLASVVPAIAGYDRAGAQRLFDDLISQLRALPGVTAVTMARRVPLSADGGGATVDIAPPDAVAGARPVSIHFNSVLPNYFDAMGTRLLRGSGFPARVAATDAKMVVINDAMAQHYWPNESPIGQSIRVVGQSGGAFEIVGVVETGKYNSLMESPDQYVFFAFEQMPSGEPTLVIRTERDAALLGPAVRQLVRKVDPRLPMLDLITLDQHMAFALYEPRAMAAVVGTLSLFGVTLSLIGLYAVIAFFVARQRREIGVRIAVGAQPRDILRHVLRQAAMLAGGGLVLGLPLAFVATRGLSGSLVGVGAADPATYVAVAAALAAVSLGAAWHPARRALRIDPVQALRNE